MLFLISLAGTRIKAKLGQAVHVPYLTGDELISKMKEKPIGVTIFHDLSLIHI